MIEFRSVSKVFGKIVALRDISFKIEDGEFVFIVGPSGAGKTTLFRLLVREFLPTTGKIFIDNHDITTIPRSKVPDLRQRIGLVFQDYRLIYDRTISENVEVALAISSVPKKEWKSRIDHVLKLVGLSDRANLFPSQLSGGELQRAALARAVVINPSIIFADEPTGNLDWETSMTIVDLLVKINNEGKTILVTTHNKALLEKMKKRVIELKDGRINKDYIHK